MKTVSSADTLSRRRFMKRLALATATTTVAPCILASDKTGNRTPVLGSCDYTYEAIHDWGTLPAGHVYGNTHAVCEDSQGRIHIKHTVGAGAKCEDAIVVFDQDGKFINSWGSDFKGGAHGMQLNREGTEEFFYLCDPNRHLVMKTTLDGREIFRLGFPEASNAYTSAKEYRPTNIAVAPNGDFYVADGYGKSLIHQYDSEANYLRTFGGKGSEAGHTQCPHGLMVDTRNEEPTLVVADRGNRRLQYFTLEGKHLCFVTNDLHAPCHFHERNNVLLIPDLESRITLLDHNNKLITHLGEGTGYKALRDKPRDRFTPGQFIAPHGACFDHEGNIFVTEWVEVGRVTKLRKVS